MVTNNIKFHRLLLELNSFFSFLVSFFVFSVYLSQRSSIARQSEGTFLLKIVHGQQLKRADHQKMIPQNSYLRSFTRAAISPVCLNSLLRHMYIIHNNASAKLICANLAFAHLLAGCSPKTKLGVIVITSSS